MPLTTLFATITSKMRSLGLLLLPNMLASSLTLPLEIFNAAFDTAIAKRIITVRPTINFISHNDSPVKSNTGVMFAPTNTFQQVGSIDALIIPSLWRSSSRNIKSQAAACDYLGSFKNNLHTKICAVGTGSALLAEAGLLNGKPATTHWFYFDQMERMYPKANWRRHHLITQSDNIYCAGSVNSVADLSIHIIQEFFGNDVAQLIEQQFSPEVRQPLQTQLFDASHNSIHEDELIAEIQRFIYDNLTLDINFEKLAEKHKISIRTMQRRFKTATGFSPLQYQQSRRIDSAKTLLSSSNETIEGISSLVGYSDSSQFSKLFKKHALLTPSNYRKTVRGKLFSASDN